MITHAHWFRMKYQERSKLRINVIMSKKVRTRNSTQCHNHHQKMLKRLGSLEALIEHIKEEKEKKRRIRQEKKEEKLRKQA